MVNGGAARVDGGDESASGDKAVVCAGASIAPTSELAEGVTAAETAAALSGRGETLQH